MLNAAARNWPAEARHIPTRDEWPPAGYWMYVHPGTPVDTVFERWDTAAEEIDQVLYTTRSRALLTLYLARLAFRLGTI